MPEEILGTVEIDSETAEVVRQGGPNLLLRTQSTRHRIAGLILSPERLKVNSCYIDYQPSGKAQVVRVAVNVDVDDSALCHRNLAELVKAARMHPEAEQLLGAGDLMDANAREAVLDDIRKLFARLDPRARREFMLAISAIFGKIRQLLVDATKVSSTYTEATEDGTDRT